MNYYYHVHENKSQTILLQNVNDKSHRIPNLKIFKIHHK
jgi:hypothetical protein